MIVALLGACGPEAQDVPEIQPWMSGIWSGALMTEYEMSWGPDGGLGENNRSQPERFEIFGDGTYEVFTLVMNPDVFPSTYYDTFASTWEVVDDNEIRADRHDESPDSTLAYRWELGTGERGCDTIVVTILEEEGEDGSFNLYRGAICTVQQEPCPPDATPPHNCFYYHYTWCEDQGTNELWMDRDGEDAYCHVPGYEADE